MPVRDLSALGLGELLGAVLTAVVDAQRDATASSLAFVKDVGLLSEPDGSERFRTVTLKYTKLDENREPASFTLEVPLLAMVAIPTLAVRSATVSFTYDVTESSVVEPAGADERALMPSRLGGLGVQPVVLKGFVQRPTTTRTTTNEVSGLRIEVTVESEPLPDGLIRILELTDRTSSVPAPPADA